MVGAIATNLHEGSRSEYLAQFIFASFGTAVPVPHQEDTGVDLYCTFTERIGSRSWPRAYFAVQVKSTMDSWVFDGAESVRWLVEHPLPLCPIELLSLSGIQVIGEGSDFGRHLPEISDLGVSIDPPFDRSLISWAVSFVSVIACVIHHDLLSNVIRE